ncbi:hypothetical protein HELRODRAFT_181829 [Helobdella robusta]|uniref:Uncharacterized protein n=1 Tax=Helobdella robusta TaxID=6412 RepID=T1FHD9_HELRO|nr:hypothetical protein HELRODRAFT_181829 [Helobdella robusta]ESN92052.1 hypothetical protein HELRODRAFT_181829 [Helobdella robusta]
MKHYNNRSNDKNTYDTMTKPSQTRSEVGSSNFSFQIQIPRHLLSDELLLNRNNNQLSKSSKPTSPLSVLDNVQIGSQNSLKSLACSEAAIKNPPESRSSPKILTTRDAKSSICSHSSEKQRLNSILVAENKTPGNKSRNSLRWQEELLVKESKTVEEVIIPDDYETKLQDLRDNFNGDDNNFETFENQLNKNIASRNTTNNSNLFIGKTCDRDSCENKNDKPPSSRNRRNDSARNFNSRGPSSSKVSSDKNFSRLSQHSNSQHSNNYPCNENLNTNSLSHFSRLNSCGNSPQRSKLSSNVPISQLNSLYSHLPGHKTVHKKGSDEMFKFQNLKKFNERAEKTYSLQNNDSPGDRNSNFNRTDENNNDDNDEENDDDDDGSGDRNNGNISLNGDEFLTELNLTKSQLIDIQYNLLKNLLNRERGKKDVNVKAYIKNAVKSMQENENQASMLNSSKFMSSEPVLTMESNSTFTSKQRHIEQNIYQMHSKNQNNKLEAEHYSKSEAKQKMLSNNSTTNTCNNSRHIEKRRVRECYFIYEHPTTMLHDLQLNIPKIIYKRNDLNEKITKNKSAGGSCRIPVLKNDKENIYGLNVSNKSDKKFNKTSHRKQHLDRHTLDSNEFISKELFPSSTNQRPGDLNECQIFKSNDFSKYSRGSKRYASYDEQKEQFQHSNQQQHEERHFIQQHLPTNKCYRIPPNPSKQNSTTTAPSTASNFKAEPSAQNFGASVKCNSRKSTIIKNSNDNSARNSMVTCKLSEPTKQRCNINIHQNEELIKNVCEFNSRNKRNISGNQGDEGEGESEGESKTETKAESGSKSEGESTGEGEESKGESGGESEKVLEVMSIKDKATKPAARTEKPNSGKPVKSIKPQTKKPAAKPVTKPAAKRTAKPVTKPEQKLEKKIEKIQANNLGGFVSSYTQNIDKYKAALFGDDKPKGVRKKDVESTTTQSARISFSKEIPVNLKRSLKSYKQEKSRDESARRQKSEHRKDFGEMTSFEKSQLLKKSVAKLRRKLSNSPDHSRGSSKRTNRRWFPPRHESRLKKLPIHQDFSGSSRSRSISIERERLWSHAKNVCRLRKSPICYVSSRSGIRRGRRDWSLTRDVPKSRKSSICRNCSRTSSKTRHSHWSLAKNVVKARKSPICRDCSRSDSNSRIDDRSWSITKHACKSRKSPICHASSKSSSNNRLGGRSWTIARSVAEARKSPICRNCSSTGRNGGRDHWSFSRKMKSSVSLFASNSGLLSRQKKLYTPTVNDRYKTCGLNYYRGVSTCCDNLTKQTKMTSPCASLCGNSSIYCKTNDSCLLPNLLKRYDTPLPSSSPVENVNLLKQLCNTVACLKDNQKSIPNFKSLSYKNHNSPCMPDPICCTSYCIQAGQRPNKFPYHHAATTTCCTPKTTCLSPLAQACLQQCQHQLQQQQCLPPQQQQPHQQQCHQPQQQQQQCQPQQQRQTLCVQHAGTQCSNSHSCSISRDNFAKQKPCSQNAPQLNSQQLAWLQCVQQQQQQEQLLQQQQQQLLQQQLQPQTPLPIPAEYTNSIHQHIQMQCLATITQQQILLEKQQQQQQEFQDLLKKQQRELQLQQKQQQLQQERFLKEQKSKERLKTDKTERIILTSVPSQNTIHPKCEFFQQSSKKSEKNLICKKIDSDTSKQKLVKSTETIQPTKKP